MKTKIRIGTRGSALALYQAELVKSLIGKDFPLIVVEIVKIKTSGDMIRRGGNNPFVTKRIFTREIEDALLKKEVDIAVHSAKDMSVFLPDGLKIGAVLEREDPRDCLVSKDKKKLCEMPLGARIGTSSLRRKMQLLRLHPELIVEEVHGNVETRIKKTETGDFDAVVLAHAGMKRLGLVNNVAEIFPEETFYPSPGQGAIVAQTRTSDREMEEILEVLHHVPTGKRISCERAFLARLEGGCQLPCGITTHINGNVLQTAGALFGTEGHDWVEAKHEGSLEDPTEAGDALAKVLLENGGQKILDQIRYSVEGKHKSAKSK